MRYTPFLNGYTFKHFAQEFETSFSNPKRWKRKLGNGQFQTKNNLETTVSNPQIENGTLEAEFRKCTCVLGRGMGYTACLRFIDVRHRTQEACEEVYDTRWNNMCANCYTPLGASTTQCDVFPMETRTANKPMPTSPTDQTTAPKEATPCGEYAHSGA